ncbi:hypothetical protein DOY81_014444 [Sarcophaga bullata]|nr:hypothetical protein DOY81_014444 [Sarcophaga bullata]
MECIAKGPPNTEFSICFVCNESGRIVMKFLVNFEKTSVVRSYQREGTIVVGDFTVKNIEYHSDSPLLDRVEKLSLI